MNMGTMNVTPQINPKFPLQMWARNLGMWEVTEKNWPEFFVRIRLYEELAGAPMLRNADTNEPVTITPELAKQHIGCRLGDKMETRDEWWLRIMHGRATSLEYEARNFDPEVFPLPDEDDAEL
jgi:hypothetical protein